MSTRIALLGLGEMGRRMASRLLQAGHELTVWNRSPDRVDALVAAGARRADSPRQAAAQAEVVIAMLRDDQASQAVWCDAETGALAGMRPGTVAIESSTLSLAGVRALAAQAAKAGVDLLDAPVSGSLSAAEAGQLVYLVGGEAAVLQRVEPVLRSLGAAVRHVGPSGQGAAAKLVTNTLLGLHVAALAELLGMLRQQGLQAEAVLQAVAATPVWAPVDHYLAGSMLAGDFRPQFPVDLMAKDFGYVLAAAGGGTGLPVAAAALGVYQRAQAAALGAANMTGVARLYEAAQPSA